MAPDGHDLVAALETVRVLADGHEIDRAIDAAFPGAALSIESSNGRYALSLRFAKAPRPFAASELSDGTLRYLCLVGALLGYRLPSLVVLNEPETSLHSDLWPALASLVARGGRRAQIWVTTHATGFARALEREGATMRRVRLVDGATGIDGLSPLGVFSDAED